MKNRCLTKRNHARKDRSLTTQSGLIISQRTEPSLYYIKGRDRSITQLNARGETVGEGETPEGERPGGETPGRKDLLPYKCVITNRIQLLKNSNSGIIIEISYRGPYYLMVL